MNYCFNVYSCYVVLVSLGVGKNTMLNQYPMRCNLQHALSLLKHVIFIVLEYENYFFIIIILNVLKY